MLLPVLLCASKYEKYKNWKMCAQFGATIILNSSVNADRV